MKEMSMEFFVIRKSSTRLFSMFFASSGIIR